MKKYAKFLRILALFSVFCSASAAPSITSLSGEFNTSSSGAATYRIPLDLPVGSAGMEPKIALRYNSQAGNSLAGLGWSLEGLDPIVRCPRTQAQDGMRGGINHDSNDRFCLNGQRLMVINGSYGSSNSEYRFEVDDFSRILAYGSAGGGPAYFKIQTKNSLTLEYGATTDSRIEPQGKSTAHSWALNKISDARGNSLRISYLKDSANTFAYPTKIEYFAASGTAAMASVDFEYEPRPDTPPSYEAGSLLKIVNRLKAIQTKVEGVTVFRYQFSYAAFTHATDSSRIVSIAKCSAEGVCLTPIEFNWLDGAFAATGEYWSVSPDRSGYAEQLDAWSIAADLDGDGRTDLAGKQGTKQGGRRYCVARDKKFICGAEGYQGGVMYIKPGDFNGDGRVDLASPDGGICLAALSEQTPPLPVNFKCNTWELDASNQIPLQKYSFGDFDGDGRTDFISEIGVGMWRICLSVGNAFSCANWSGHSGGASNNIISDFNGDGKSDMAGYTGSGGVWHVCLSSGNAFQCEYWNSHGGGVNNNVLADFNGDGKMDMAGYTGANGDWHVCLATGSGFSCNYWSGPWAGVDNNFLGDFNGDGRADMLADAGNGRWVICFSNGSGFNCDHFQGHGGGAPNNIVGDFDGDGNSEFMGYTGALQWHIISGGAKRRLVREITFAAAQKISIEYKPLSGGARYSKDSGAAYPLINKQMALYVVDQVSRTDGIGGTATQQFSYGGMNGEIGTGRGLAGFRWIGSKDLATGMEAYSEFKQDWPFGGLLVKSEARLNGQGNAGLLARTTNEYAKKTGSASQSVFVHQTKSVQERWDLNGAALPSVTTTLEYQQNPQYGYPTKQILNYSDGGGRTVVNEYWPANISDGKWIIGKPKKITTTSVTP